MSIELPVLDYGATWPPLDTFAVLAEDRRVIPVVRRLLADGETPLGLYRKLAQGRPGTFLLESAAQGQQVGRGDTAVAVATAVE